MRKIFRHGFASYLLMISFCISCFVLIYGVNVVCNVRNEDLSINKFKEQLREEYDITSLENESVDYKKLAEVLINDALQVDTCNISFITKLYINNRVDWFETNLIVKENEPNKINVSEKISQTKGIYIGESLKKYLGEYSNSDELLINDEACKVSGILQNNMASDIDNSIYIVWSECDSNVKRILIESLALYIEDGFLKVVYESDDDIEEALNCVNGLFEEKNIYDDGVDNMYSGEYQNYWYKYYNYIFVGIALAFAIINCIYVSAFWLLHRKHEIKIRIACGYRKFDLYGLLFKDSAFICSCAYALTLCFVFIFSYFLNLINLFENIFLKIMMSFGLMLMILVILSLISINKFMKRNIVDV